MFSSIKERLEEIERLREIASVLFNHEMHFLLHSLRLRVHLPFLKSLTSKRKISADRLKEKNIEDQARVIREIFEDLGGTFLKLGQMLSQRPDLVGKELSCEFEKLLDSVPHESFAQIEKTLEKGMPDWKRIFSNIDHEPIASGSIAQVHKALLQDGNIVAVKIERPGIKDKFRMDIMLMEMLARRLKKSYNIEFLNPIEVVEEFKKYTMRELDLSHEASNIERFRTGSKGKLKIPQVYRKYSSQNVLVMEFIDGKKIEGEATYISKAKRQQIVKTLTTAVFEQLFVEGFFHADLHPGNILLCNNYRDIALLDYGIVGYIDREMREKLTSLFIALVNGDLESAAGAIIDLNIGPAIPDKNILKEGIYYTLGEYYGRGIEEVPFGEVFYNIIDTAKKSRIKMPSQLILFSKSIITMEGLCRQLDPKYNIAREARPFVKGLYTREFNPKSILKEGVGTAISMKRILLSTPSYIKDFSNQMQLIEKSTVELDMQFRAFQHLMLKLTKSIIYGIVLAAVLIVSASFINMGPKYFNISIYSILGGIVSVCLIIAMIATLGSRHRL